MLLASGFWPLAFSEWLTDRFSQLPVASSPLPLNNETTNRMERDQKNEQHDNDT
jgi:hypothetical protein